MSADDFARPLLAVRDSPGRGRGVFAAAPLASRATVAVSPVLFFGDAEYEAHGRHTALAGYTFLWRPPRGTPGELGARGHALALGAGSLFNHAREPNTGWLCDFAERAIRYVALRDIAVGEELFISYAPAGALWFEDAGGESSDSSESGDGGDAQTADAREGDHLG